LGERIITFDIQIEIEDFEELIIVEDAELNEWYVLKCFILTTFLLFEIES
jgi:hypothetical protein